MAEQSVTAANVAIDSTSEKQGQIVDGGATITAGQVLYKDSADSEYKLVDANNGSAATALASAVAVSGGADGQEMVVATRGASINCGFTTTSGEVYCASSTDALTVNGNAGGICLHSDLGSGDRAVVLFVGTGTAVVKLLFEDAGVIA